MGLAVLGCGQASTAKLVKVGAWKTPPRLVLFPWGGASRWGGAGRAWGPLRGAGHGDPVFRVLICPTGPGGTVAASGVHSGREHLP